LTELVVKRLNLLTATAPKVKVINQRGSIGGVVLAAKPKKAAYLYTSNWPTDSMGWIIAYCARRVQEGLTRSFATAGYRVSPELWSIIVQLWEDNDQPQQALADRFHRSKVAAFHLISKLEEQGIVERKPNLDDKRSNLVHLTAKGRAMAAELIPLGQQNIDRALKGIPPEEVEIARSVLFRIANNMAE
jgi:DNA-binding MarR family transcriptional regulator